MLREHGPIGVLVLSDQIRADAPRAATAVTALTGSTPVLLTGDNARHHPSAGRTGRHHRRAQRSLLYLRLFHKLSTPSANLACYLCCVDLRRDGFPVQEMAEDARMRYQISQVGEWAANV